MKYNPHCFIFALSWMDRVKSHRVVDRLSLLPLNSDDDFVLQARNAVYDPVVRSVLTPLSPVLIFITKNSLSIEHFINNCF